MGTLLDLASLVVVPSGYKEDVVYSVKPTDGSGDLDFTRSNDTATRVNSAGLIEKVRTNLILQSNTFDTTWTNLNSTETSGQTGYDGTNNAWLLTDNTTNGVHALRQTPSVTGLVTFSVYAKAGTLNWMFLRGVQSSANVRAWFNLSTGTIGTVEANGTAKMQSVGNGWYRCSLTIANMQSGFEVYIATASGDNTEGYVGSGQSIIIQNSQYELGDIATDYIPTTTAAVSVGMTANVPRLDYSGGGCPKLLLEPQRTNLLTFSEQFSSWTLIGGGSVTSNTAISPDGYANADTIEPLGYARRLFTMAGGSNTFSIYLKAKDTNCVVRIGFLGAGDSSLIDVQETITTSTWKRMTLTYTNATAPLGVYFDIQSGDNDVYVWGAQVEAGAYPTSYIPTLGAAVTRGADACFKTGISSLIGQTQGTIFTQVKISAWGQQLAIITSAAGNEVNRLQLYIDASGKIGLYRGDASVNILSSTTYAIGSTLKIAAIYQLNNFALYVNGVSVGTDTSGTTPPTPSVLYLAQYVDNAASAAQFNEVIIFPTILTNTQLTELTTI